MARFARVALATVSAVGLAISAAPAHADQAAGASKAAPSCEATVGGLTAAGVTLPSNAPALLLIDSPYSGMQATVSAELVSADKRIPFAAPAKDTHGLNALTLPSAAVGSHTVAMKVSCNGYEPPAREFALTLTEAVPLPTAIGTLSVVTKNPPTGVDTIRLDPTPGLRAFLAATQFTMSVDGTPDTRPYGAMTSPEIAFSVQTGSVCVENGALHREKRDVKISVGAAIAGVPETLPAATLDITVDCGAIRWTSESDFAGASNGGAPASTPGATSDSTTSGGGCTAAPSGKVAGSAPGIVALALASLVALRRRRRV